MTPKEAKSIEKYKCYSCVSSDKEVDDAYKQHSKQQLTQIIKQQLKELKEKIHMKNEINNLKQSLAKVSSANGNYTKKLSAWDENPRLRQQIQTLTAYPH